MIKKLIPAILFASFIIGCNSNEPAPGNTAAPEVDIAAEKAAVGTAVENLRKAMVDGDSTALDKLTVAQLSYGHSSGKIEDKAAFIHSLVSGASDFVTIDLTDQTVEVFDNVAIVRHNLNATTNDNGNQGTVALHILTNWIKQGADWKLFSRQAVKVPPPTTN